MTPFIIVGGILLGWFTPTESAAVAVVYAAALSLLFYREMSARQLWDALLDTGKLAGVALFCVGTASVFGWLLAYYQIPRALLANVQSWGLGLVGVGFFVAFVFLVVGCFLDAIPAIIIVGTTLQPLTEAVHMHPVSFAIIGIVALAFGLVTPPYGMCLMISCAIAKVRLRYALKDTMIMLVPMLLVLAMLIVWPEIALILPQDRARRSSSNDPPVAHPARLRCRGRGHRPCRTAGRCRVRRTRARVLRAPRAGRCARSR